MKESVTKFDLEAAFKALDDIDVPASEKGIKANRPALTEIFSQKTKFESLFEEYYDIGNQDELGEAKEAREAEVAKAKLARIEKIVDLDADSPEDLLTSYVGKYIIQCPQCMTLFYKNQEDVVESEDDKTTVNVGEVCQHCGNESGYTLIGKVGEAEEETTEVADETAAEEVPAEEAPEEEQTEENTEESTEGEEDLGDLDFDLDLEEPVEEEKTEESFNTHEGEALVEELADDKELDAKLKAHNEYIEYTRNAISDAEAELEKADNEQIKSAIQRRIDALKADLEAALPDEVKNDLAVETQENTVEDAMDEIAEETPEEPVEETSTEETAEEPVEEALGIYGNVLTEALHEEADIEVSADEFEELINSPEFKKPITDTAVRAMLNADKKEDEKEEANESLEEGIFDGTGLTRASHADWILKNAREDYNNSNSGLAFNTFVVYYFKGNFRKDQNDTEGKGKKITVAPKPDNKDLVVGKAPEAKKSYKDAEKLAAGWSMINGNGPAMIFMAKGLNEANKTFLCEYFKGSLVESSDQLATMIDQIKKSLKGAKKMAKGNSGKAEVVELTTDKLTKGVQIQLDNDTVASVEAIEAGMLGGKEVTLKLADGATKTLNWPANAKFKVIAATIGTSATESLHSVMADVEELQEEVLEKLISDSLVEAYGNVAGYRIADCEYLNEKLVVNGTAYFTSGNTRKLAYTFTEAFSNEGKVEFQGLNEKLGADKKFTLTGKIENKTLITESFKCNK